MTEGNFRCGMRRFQRAPEVRRLLPWVVLSDVGDKFRPGINTICASKMMRHYQNRYKQIVPVDVSILYGQKLEKGIQTKKRTLKIAAIHTRTTLRVAARRRTFGRTMRPTSSVPAISFAPTTPNLLNSQLRKDSAGTSSLRGRLNSEESGKPR